MFNVEETGSPLVIYHFCGRLKPCKQNKAQEIVIIWFLMQQQTARTYYMPRNVIACSTREADAHFKVMNIGHSLSEIKNDIGQVWGYNKASGEF